MSDAFLLSIEDAVATITINDAPYNLMSLQYIDDLEVLLPELAANDEVSAVIFTGSGLAHFSAGMNLKQIPEGIKAKGSQDAFFDQRWRVIAAIENLGKPCIATLYGFCLGAGLELPLACHFRIAADEGAQIGLPEMDLGTVPAWGGSARLPRRVGRDVALDMILRGKKIDGQEALRVGLVNEVCPVDEIKQRAMALAKELAAQPRLAMKGVLDTVVGFESRSLEQSLQDERKAVHLNSGTADAKEGITAFLEKRKPVFNQ